MYSLQIASALKLLRCYDTSILSKPDTSLRQTVRVWIPKVSIVERVNCNITQLACLLKSNVTSSIVDIFYITACTNGLISNIEKDKRLHKADYGTLSWLKEWKMVNFKLCEKKCKKEMISLSRACGTKTNSESSTGFEPISPKYWAIALSTWATENSWRVRPYTQGCQKVLK